jgi:hypothetical protein
VLWSPPALPCPTYVVLRLSHFKYEHTMRRKRFTYVRAGWDVLAMHKRTPKDLYLREYAAALRACARRSKGKVRIRLGDVANFIDLLADKALADTSCAERTRTNGVLYPTISTFSGSAAIKVPDV